MDPVDALKKIEQIEKNSSDSSVSSDSTDSWAYFDNGSLGVFGIIILAQVLVSNRSIKRITISNETFYYKAIKELASSLKNIKTLKTVEFVRISMLSIASILTIGKVLQFSSITVCALSSCNINNLTLFKFVEALKGNTSLKKLNLNNNKFNATGVKLLFKGLADIVGFEELSIQDNNLGDAGGRAIAVGLSLNNICINKLDIGSCDIGDKGVQEIGKVLKNNTSLSSLMIDHNNISCDSLRGLLEILKVNRTLICLYACYSIASEPNDYTNIINNNDNALVLLMCDILKSNPNFEKMYLPTIEFNYKNLELLLDTIKNHKHIQEIKYHPKYRNTRYNSYINEISSILNQNKLLHMLESIRCALKDHFVLTKLPEEMWMFICDYLPYEDLVNFHASLSLEY
jgi:hypothetical protein